MLQKQDIPEALAVPGCSILIRPLGLRRVAVFRHRAHPTNFVFETTRLLISAADCGDTYGMYAGCRMSGMVKPRSGLQRLHKQREPILLGQVDPRTSVQAISTHRLPCIIGLLAI